MSITQFCWRFLFVISLQVPVTALYAQDWKAVINKADSLQKAQNFPAAIKVSKEALKLAKASFGEIHLNCAASLMQLGEIQAELGDYMASDSTTSASRNLLRKLNLTDHQYYLNTTVTLALLRSIQNKFSQSETYYQEALQLIEKAKGKESFDYVDIIGDMGSMYLSSGNYAKAEEWLLLALGLKAKLVGKQSEPYANSLNNLGQLYAEKDDFARAESYLQESIRIREKLFGSDGLALGAPLSNLAYAYGRQGDYQASLKLALRVIKLQEDKGVKDRVYLTQLNNAATMYTRLREFSKADSLYVKLHPMIAASVGTSHRQYAVLLSNRGVVQLYLNNYESARQLLEKAYGINVANVGEKHPGSLNMLASLAQVYSYLNRPQEADSLYRKVRVLGATELGMQNLDYSEYLNKYSQFYLHTNQVDSALAMTGKVVAAVSANLTRSFLYQTTRQQENLLVKCAPFVSTAFEIAYNAPRNVDAIQLAYSGNLFLKNLLLNQHVNQFNGNTQANDRLHSLTDTLRLVSNQIATQYTLPVAQRTDLDSLETKAETLEKELARQSAPFRQAQQDVRTRWEDIRNALKPHEAAIEFVSFPYHNGREQTDSIRYLALVLRPNDPAPHLVPLLTDEAPLRRLLARRRGAALYATRGSEIDTDQLAQGDSLYRLIWHPIEQLLADTKTVYFSPAGLLHQVAFAALPYRSKSGNGANYLIDRYQLKQVSSTRQVVTQTADVAYSAVESVYLYGGIQYDSTGGSPEGWPYLPGTQQEAEQIGQLVGSKARLITGSNATETHLKRVSGQSPTVLHLATHGFSFPEPTVSAISTVGGGNTFRRISNPLFRTGLLMADANRVWQGGTLALGKDDGVLTAYEVASLNLSTTKLVVLSACETVMGDIRGSEGVFGLQRAFKMAGARYLLMSLWPVSDQATSHLMTRFYRNWKKYKTTRRAFEQTLTQMRRQYPPAVWASFVLVE